MTIVKSFTYRGAAEEWSNTYHLTDHPADEAGWRTLSDWLMGYEKTVYSARCTIERSLCYDDSDDPVTYTYNLADWGGVVSGTFSASAGAQAPGDVAAWVRWFTGDRNSKGKPVYLRKYFHDVEVNGYPNADQITSTQVTAYQAFGDQLLTPIHAGISLAKPDGSLPDGPAACSTYATTRTLKRRGRRP